MIDLSNGEIRVGQKATVTLSKTEVLLSRDSKDLNELIGPYSFGSGRPYDLEQLLDLTTIRM